MVLSRASGEGGSVQVARRSECVQAPPLPEGRKETTGGGLRIDLRRTGARGREGGEPEPLSGARVPERRAERQRAEAAGRRAFCARGKHRAHAMAM